MALNEMFSNVGGANNRCDGSPIYIWLPKHMCSPAASMNRASEVSMRNAYHQYLHTTYNSGGIMLLVACCPFGPSPLLALRVGLMVHSDREQFANDDHVILAAMVRRATTLQGQR